MFTPVGLKSAALRMTTAMPCTNAVAAMSSSRSPRLSGACRRAQHCAAAASIGHLRTENSSGASEVMVSDDDLYCVGSLNWLSTWQNMQQAQANLL
ncbi:hypothetical protein VB145_20165 [Xanthomonas arboricola]|uniref:hypothetical protein n=1 Tax=Xanthomonas arboricola TaxID=56448 RepID=UPI00069ECA33|nr:hypothetical protein [Xanthomonas arboricola]AKU51168.1 hypothetical protein AKJ12_16165 [Xanthomonas arboricola pv. juglandis]KOB26929.1 hypothetical protein AE927_12015 [Xanthomonas arboricola]KOB49534.1 hypothetical protein AE932_11665 [Xanthomonas arboricola]MEA5150675.1 hypothetical protein [Xanthomonas arboricola]UQP96887.1 hypothetical protein KP728_14995 [Xanthomonas arboricola pv. juglandis]